MARFGVSEEQGKGRVGSQIVNQRPGKGKIESQSVRRKIVKDDCGRGIRRAERVLEARGCVASAQGLRLGSVGRTLTPA